MCVLQKATPRAIPLTVYTLYAELYARFDSITWGLIQEAMSEEGAIDEEEGTEYVLPQTLVCDFTDHPDEVELAQYDAAQSESIELSATLAVSAALHEAVETSHRIFDLHLENSSMDYTVQKLEHAWRPVCESLGCDHTNYWDFLVASHGHSLMLSTIRAPAKYIHSQIHDRVLLENRVQHFLGAHGDDFARRAYRHEDVQPVHYDNMNVYFEQARTAMMKHVSGVVSALDVGTIGRIKRFFDGDRMEAFLSKRRASDGDAKDAAELMEVKWFWEWVEEVFSCAGNVKTMVATGYCKKFPAPTSLVGVGMGIAMSGSVSITKVLKGEFPGAVAAAISVVFGAVPGTPLTGGVRVGVGVGLSASCTTGGCTLGLSVGAVTSAIWPSYVGHYCVAGPVILGVFKCMNSAGLSVSLVCCNWNFITGETDCR